jgi:ketosteroid isomerase-like protein
VPSQIVGFAALSAALSAAALSTALVCASALAAPAAASPASDEAAVAEVTKLEKALVQLYNSPQFAKDPSVALAYFDGTDAMRLFDIMLPVEYRGADFRKHFIEVGAQFVGGKLEMSNLEVSADGTLAFASLIEHFSGKDKDGKPYALTMRVTDGLRKTGGHWLITHEHASIALDGPTFLSIITSKP